MPERFQGQQGPQIHEGSSPSPIQHAAFSAFQPSLGLSFHVLNSICKRIDSTVLCACIIPSCTHIAQEHYNVGTIVILLHSTDVNRSTETFSNFLKVT